ncbi:dTDP-4-dehydrorhamnose reductase [Leifsonia kafniensis]|uniref:dTDP-4-dehydrorhamnose reductase n=1 Tax=Leifsonia kafniensis TaxID=475957 RepID=A0ABP7K8H6_9MICO
MHDATLEWPLVAATGMTGMIGRRAKELFPELGWDSLGVDITDQSAVDAAVASTRASVIINLAAYTDVSGARQQHDDIDAPCFRINVDGARNLAAACARSGKHFVQVSTDYVFEGDRAGPYLESDDGDARSDWYGVTKSLAEGLIKQSDGGWAIARLSFPYQQHSQRKTDIVRRIGAQLKTGSISAMFSDQIITPTFSDDAVGTLAHIARTRAQGVFHAVGPEWLSPHQVATRVAESLGLDAATVPSGSLKSYVNAGGRPFPQTLRMSSEATKSLLNQPTHTLSEALRLPGWVF